MYIHYPCHSWIRILWCELFVQFHAVINLSNWLRSNDLNYLQCKTISTVYSNWPVESCKRVTQLRNAVINLSNWLRSNDLNYLQCKTISTVYSNWPVESCKRVTQLRNANRSFIKHTITQKTIFLNFIHVIQIVILTLKSEHK
jgi:hypothetical protein